MPIEVKCDFCNKLIETKRGKGQKSGNETVEVKERICDSCAEADLNEVWDEMQDQVDEEWSVIEAEKQNFVKQLLINQKRDFRKKKKKELFGTHYKEK